MWLLLLGCPMFRFSLSQCDKWLNNPNEYRFYRACKITLQLPWERNRVRERQRENEKVNWITFLPFFASFLPFALSSFRCFFCSLIHCTVTTFFDTISIFAMITLYNFTFSIEKMSDIFLVSRTIFCCCCFGLLCLICNSISMFDHRLTHCHGHICLSMCLFMFFLAHCSFATLWLLVSRILCIVHTISSQKLLKSLA